MSMPGALLPYKELSIVKLRAFHSRKERLLGSQLLILEWTLSDTLCSVVSY